jgi:hypothetical protein
MTAAKLVKLQLMAFAFFCWDRPKNLEQFVAID